MAIFIAHLVAGFLNIGLFFLLFNFLFKKRLSLEMKILITFLSVLIIDYLLDKSLTLYTFIINGIPTVVIYLFLLKKENGEQNKPMKEKIKTQKGFIQIPLLIAIIVSIVAASIVTTGMVLHKQGKLTPLIASVSQVFKGTKEIEPEVRPEEPQAEKEQDLISESELEEELQLSEGLNEKQKEISQIEQELEQTRLEKAKQEAEKAKQEAEKAKAEAERLKREAEEIRRKAEEEALKKAQEEARIKAEQELQRQLETQRLAEEQRKQEEAQRIAEERRRQEELAEAIKEEKRQLENLLTQELNNYYSQLNSLNSQILTKENEINSIIEEYNGKITEVNGNPWLSEVGRVGRVAKLMQERDAKLAPLYRELQSLQNQYSRLTGSPLTITPPSLQSRAPTYLRFQPDGSGGGVLYDPSGTTYLRVQPDGGGGYIFYGY